MCGCQFQLLSIYASIVQSTDALISSPNIDHQKRSHVSNEITHKLLWKQRKNVSRQLIKKLPGEKFLPLQYRRDTSSKYVPLKIKHDG